MLSGSVRSSQHRFPYVPPGRSRRQAGVLLQGHPRPWPVAKLRTLRVPARKVQHRGNVVEVRGVVARFGRCAGSGSLPPPALPFRPQVCGLHSRAGSFRHQKPCARRGQSHRFCCLHSSVSRQSGGLVYTPAATPPASASCRCAQLAEASGRRGGSPPLRVALLRAAGAACVRSVSLRATPCASFARMGVVGVVPLFVGECWFAGGRRAPLLRWCCAHFFRALRVLRARAGEAVCLPTMLAVFAGGREPGVSQPLRRQSPSATLRARPPPRPCLRSLRSLRLLGHWQTHSRHRTIPCPRGRQL